IFKPGLSPRRHPSLHAVGSENAILDIVDAIARGIVGTGNGGSNALAVVGVNGAFPRVVGDLAIGRQSPEGTHPIVPRQQGFAAIHLHGIEAESRKLDRRIEPFLALPQTLVSALLLVDVLDENGRARDCSRLVAERGRADPVPMLASIRPGILEIGSWTDDFSSERSSAWVFIERKERSACVDGSPSRA